MPRRRTDTIGRAGEHYVAAELNRRGAYASPFSGNVPGIDIVATDADRTNVAYIQVKTKREGGNWQVGIQHGWAKITPHGCPKTGRCPKNCTPKLDEPISGRTDHYWVFVSLLKDGGQRYYIFLDDDVRGRLIRKPHQAYLCKHGGQRPGNNHDSTHHIINEEDLRDSKDKWNGLGLGLADGGPEKAAR